MTEAGFTKNGDDLWEKDGKTINATIQAFESIHGDIAPVLVEMLRQAGFDANVNFGTDAYQNMVDGKAGLYMFGHGASLLRPVRGAQPLPRQVLGIRSARRPAITASRATRTPSSTSSSTRSRRSTPTIRSSRPVPPRLWASTGAT